MPLNKHARRLDAIQARKVHPDQPKPAGKAMDSTRIASAECMLSKGEQVPDPQRKWAGNVSSNAPTNECVYETPVCILIPMPYDVSPRDNLGTMEYALFRLSKKNLRANELIHYQLPDGYIKVSSGVHGMATIWDYDIVLMAISHLNEAMNQCRAGAGKGEKPGRLFCPSLEDIFKFCKRGGGGSQKEKLLGALIRLSTTHVLIQRNQGIATHTNGESLISFFNIVNDSQTHNVEHVEIEIANWMYEEITKGQKPEVLTVHPDYFRISQGVGRFVYRLARKSAGKDMAVWGFDTLYQRSGSTGTLKEFSRLLRKTIRTKCLPEYDLAEEEGKMGSMLRIVHRAQVGKWAS
ncbi:replication initiator protein A [Pseudomonas syringae]|nr:replication initiator protein A [Pseudomonas syringae]MBD8802848.1 replication initiator protein A [Pseudomonas syringae]MBD8813560.1 replication initiator protein A [Pseudomonas syringae]